MSKVSMVLNYWIYMIVVLLMAKLFGLADNNKIMVIIIVAGTLFYIVFMKRFAGKVNPGSKKSTGKTTLKKKR